MRQRHRPRVVADKHRQARPQEGHGGEHQRLADVLGDCLQVVDVLRRSLRIEDVQGPERERLVAGAEQTAVAPLFGESARLLDQLQVAIEVELGLIQLRGDETQQDLVDVVVRPLHLLRRPGRQGQGERHVVVRQRDVAALARQPRQLGVGERTGGGGVGPFGKLGGALRVAARAGPVAQAIGEQRLGHSRRCAQRVVVERLGEPGRLVDRRAMADAVGDQVGDIDLVRAAFQRRSESPSSGMASMRCR